MGHSKPRFKFRLLESFGSIFTPFDRPHFEKLSGTLEICSMYERLSRGESVDVQVNQSLQGDWIKIGQDLHHTLINYGTDERRQQQDAAAEVATY